MDKNEKKLLKKIISEVNGQSSEEYYDILREVVYTYLKSLITFGRNSNITKEVIKIWNEFENNYFYEKELQKRLLKKYKTIHYSEALDFLDMIEEYNDESVRYYYDALDDIVDASEMKAEFRANHRPKKFKPLSETEDIDISFKGLDISIENVKEFLGYPQEFWEYIEPKIRIIDPYTIENELFYVTLLGVDDNNKLNEILVVVLPGIVNIETAAINVYELKYAYDMYKRIGQVLEEPKEKYEEEAKKMKQIFCKEYVLKKKFN